MGFPRYLLIHILLLTTVVTSHPPQSGSNSPARPICFASPQPGLHLPPLVFKAHRPGGWGAGRSSQTKQQLPPSHSVSPVDLTINAAPRVGALAASRPGGAGDPGRGGQKREAGRGDGSGGGQPARGARGGRGGTRGRGGRGISRKGESYQEKNARMGAAAAEARPSTLNTQPSTLSPEPYTLNPQNKP